MDKIIECLKTNSAEVIKNLQEIKLDSHLNKEFFTDLRDNDPTHFKALALPTKIAIAIYLGMETDE